MKSLLKIFAGICLLAILPAAPCSAATYSWNGSDSSEWSDALNWTPIGIPGTNDNVIVTNGSIDLGANVIIGGEFDWSGGALIDGTLTIATSGVLNILGTVTMSNDLNNFGTVNWQAGEIQIGLWESIWNQAGALWNIECDEQLGSGAWDTSLQYFYNAGQIIKTAGTNETYVTTILVNNGVVVAQSGTIYFDAGGTFSGIFQADTNSAIYISDGLDLEPCMLAGQLDFEGPGTVMFKDSTIGGTFSGTVNIDSLVLDSGVSLTVLTNGVLNFFDGGALNNSLTNYGTVNWQGGEIDVHAEGNYVLGAIWNEPGGIWNIECDQTMNGDPGATCYNLGEIVKTAEAGETPMNILMDNTGEVIAQTGIINIQGGGTFNGIFQAATNSAIYIENGPCVLNGPMDFEGPGIVSFNNAIVSGTFSGTINLAQCNIISGWPLTVQSNGVLNLVGEYNAVEGSLTNYGTANWEAGDSEMDDGGSIWNEPGALWNIECDQPLQDLGNGLETFYNSGEIIKSAGTNEADIGVPLISSGDVTAQSGTIGIESGGIFTGNFRAASNTAIYIENQFVFTSDPYILDGNVNFEGPGTISFINADPSGAFSGTINLSESTVMYGWPLTVLSNGTLNLVGDNNTLDGSLTNYGTVNWQSGNLEMYEFAGIWNEPNAVWNIECDKLIDEWIDPSRSFYNAGKIIKSAGTGQTEITVNLVNNGQLEIDRGIINLSDTNNILTDGSVSLLISNTNICGSLGFLGNAPLTGKLTVRLANGYTPHPGDSFPLVTYGSASGSFSPLDLPGNVPWATYYEPNELLLTAQGVQPMPSWTVSGASGQPLGFSLQFTGNTNSNYTVFATTNLALPFSNWSNLGHPVFGSNNAFQFTDPQSTNLPARFYTLQSP